MKNKTIIIILSVIISFLFLPSAGAWEDSPTLQMPSTNPYSYLPSSIRMPPSRPDRMDNPIPNIAPQVPAIITDAQGNKTITHNGRVAARVDVDGTVTYYAAGQKQFQRDALGNLTRTYEYEGNQAVIKNEFGEILGYEEYGRGGKLLYTYDSNHNLNNRFEYDSGGYWQIDMVNNIWKRFELDKPVIERRDGKYGEIVAYWVQDGDNLWRIEKTTDADGNIIDGNRTLFDRFGQEYYITYANDGTIITQYSWENHRLVYEVYQDGTYRKYNLYGVSEEGYIDPDSGIAYIEWMHTWDGTKHIKATHYNIDGTIAEVRYYDANGDIDYMTKVISQEDIDADLARAADDANKLGLTQEDLGKEVVTQDFIYFWEVKDMDVEQIQALFNLSDPETAQLIYDLIQELKDAGKSSAGLCFIAELAYTEDPYDGLTQYALNLTVFDANNLSYAVFSTKTGELLPEDP